MNCADEPDVKESPYTAPSIVTYPPCQPSPYESSSLSVCSPGARQMV